MVWHPGVGASRSGARWGLPGRPQERAKVPVLPSAGAYVYLEAPAPKLLLLICNPLRAGGKGIRGINGLTVTTTIISSGCLGQAVHTRTGLFADKHGPPRPCDRTDSSAHAERRGAMEQSPCSGSGHRHTPPVPACTPRHRPGPTYAPAQPHTGKNPAQLRPQPRVCPRRRRRAHTRVPHTHTQPVGVLPVSN